MITGYSSTALEAVLLGTSVLCVKTNDKEWQRMPVGDRTLFDQLPTVSSLTELINTINGFSVKSITKFKKSSTQMSNGGENICTIMEHYLDG
ncbi:MAG: hypothetical protein GY820_20755 [Gammaproteobacteria bacterium]|nr:hypothetical protein [Gammaproteobacteria bacterium]